VVVESAISSINSNLWEVFWSWMFYRGDWYPVLGLVSKWLMRDPLLPMFWGVWTVLKLLFWLLTTAFSSLFLLNILTPFDIVWGVAGGRLIKSTEFGYTFACYRLLGGIFGALSKKVAAFTLLIGKTWCEEGTGGDVLRVGVILW